MEDFVHLNVHTHYSTFSGVSGIQELVDKAISCDMRGMAITDDVNICGIKEFDDYVRRINKQRKNEGLEQFKPIFGCDLFVVAVVKKEQKADYIDTFGRNIIVLAKNLQGYRNLVHLVSSYGNDGWNWPIELDVLEKYHEGLIVCYGYIRELVHENDKAGIRKTIEWYQNLFGDDFYLELQRHELKIHLYVQIEEFMILKSATTPSLLEWQRNMVSSWLPPMMCFSLMRKTPKFTIE